MSFALFTTSGEHEIIQRDPYLQSLNSMPMQYSKLDLHFSLTPPDWLVGIGELLAPFRSSLEDLKISVPFLNAELATKIAGVVSDPSARLLRLEIRTMAPIPSDVAAALARCVRTNLGLAEVVLLNVAEEDESACIAAFAEELASNADRRAAVGHKHVSSSFSSSAHSSATHTPSSLSPSKEAGVAVFSAADGSAALLSRAAVAFELRVVAGGRHKLLAVIA